MHSQVGGLSTHKRPLLTIAPDYALKPLHLDHRGFREVAFYETLRLAQDDDSITMWRHLFAHAEDSMAIGEGSEKNIEHSATAIKREIQLLQRLAAFTPAYYGLVGQDTIVEPCANFLVSSQISPRSHLLLSDQTATFSKPCVVDIKMGTQSYEPDATKEKRDREISKYPNQKIFGFRLVGMRNYDPSHPQSDPAGFVFFDKIFGRKLETKEELLEAFRIFFKHGDECERVRTDVISNLLLELRDILRWFEENDCLGFYSSSLLMVFDGQLPASHHNNIVAKAKMIDFGHVTRNTKGDDGFLHGLKTLVALFDMLVEHG
jgi:1D-myo-inositol-tetrakisphosphate 5-kinase/inositol-polyphosphate multikinase